MRCFLALSRDTLGSPVRWAVAVAAALSGAVAAAAHAQEVPTSAFASMKYRHIGPLGNRITSVVGVPGDRFTYYAGAASGGVWKTEDGGVNWRPVFDDQPVHAVGEVEVAPSDPATRPSPSGGCTAPWTAAPPGRGSKAAASPPARSARSRCA